MSHQAEAFVSTCIDFRFQKHINNWIAENITSHDRVAVAGGVKNLEFVLGQIEISERLHDIKKIILTNHEDCGAYGETGTPEKHAQDLKQAKSRVKELYPNLDIQTYYIHLNGTFEKIS